MTDKRLQYRYISAEEAVLAALRFEDKADVSVEEQLEHAMSHIIHHSGSIPLKYREDKEKEEIVRRANSLIEDASHVLMQIFGLSSEKAADILLAADTLNVMTSVPDFLETDPKALALGELCRMNQIEAIKYAMERK